MLFVESTWSPLATLPILWFGYLLFLFIYRLYLHPLAKFPGPKLAALTKWYEFYYDVVQEGKYFEKIRNLHKQYGPIIRITPDELHIDDPDFFEEFYTKQGPQDKYEWMSGRFGNNTSMFATSSVDLHRMRRAPLHTLFSRQHIRTLELILRQKASKLVSRLRQYEQKNEAVPIDRALMALSQDMIYEFGFGICHDALDEANFSPNLHETFLAGGNAGNLSMQFPLIPKLMNKLPQPWVVKLQPNMATMFRLQNDIRNQVSEIEEGRNDAYLNVKHRTVIPTLFNSNLPMSEKTGVRLCNEAQTIIAAGVSTSGWSATVATGYLASKPELATKLRKELLIAIPDPTAPMDWLVLEQLPYLQACIKEGIRLSYGMSSRGPRLAHNSIHYKQWEIPAWTPVSMTAADVAHCERVFPDSWNFIPERWMNPNKSLEKYFIFFGKGPRSCLGMQLAYAELSLMLASIFRNFEVEPFETDASDVRMTRDFGIPAVKADSKGVRVKLKAITEED